MQWRLNFWEVFEQIHRLDTPGICVDNALAGSQGIISKQKEMNRNTRRYLAEGTCGQPRVP